MNMFLNIPLRLIQESKSNPRRHFDENAIQELANSIKEKGILQPLVVRSTGIEYESYEVVCGARRLRAAQLAGLADIPTIVRDLDDKAVLEIQIIENNQRQDVNALEEAAGFKALVDDHGYAVADLAIKIGRSERYVYDRLKLNNLSRESQIQSETRMLPFSFWLTLARLTHDQQQRALSQYWINSAARLNEWIRDNVTLAIQSFPFDPKRADLLPQAGACVSCPYNTANAPLLFPDLAEVKGGRCTKPECADEKRAAWLQLKLEKAEKDLGCEVTLGPEEWSYARRGDKDTPGATPCMIDSGGRIGNAWFAETLDRISDAFLAGSSDQITLASLASAIAIDTEQVKNALKGLTERGYLLAPAGFRVLDAAQSPAEVEFWWVAKDRVCKTLHGNQEVWMAHIRNWVARQTVSKLSDVTDAEWKTLTKCISKIGMIPTDLRAEPDLSQPISNEATLTELAEREAENEDGEAE